MELHSRKFTWIPALIPESWILQFKDLHGFIMRKPHAIYIELYVPKWIITWICLDLRGFTWGFHGFTWVNMEFCMDLQRCGMDFDMDLRVDSHGFTWI